MKEASIREPVSYADLVAAAGEVEGDLLVRTERRGPVALATLNDPEHRNCLSVQLVLELQRFLGAAAEDEGVRAVVLTGNGPAFCAGGDIRMMELAQGKGAGVMRPMEIRKWIRYQFGGIVRKITGMEKPVVAAVNGPAAGVGFCLVLASDIVVASEEARFGTAFVRLGLIPEVGTSWSLPRIFGYRKALELALTGDFIDAREGERFGLVNRVVAAAELMPAALALAERLARAPREVVRIAKPLMRKAMEMSWDDVLTMEEFAEPLCFSTPEHREGVRAFREKREPQFD